MARTGTSVYPATLDSFDRVGTANYEDETGYDIVNVENEAMDAIEKMQAVMGTTTGTALLASAVTASGTATLTNKTINNAIIGTSAITGGTVNNATIGTSAITGGTITNSTLVTPTVQSWDGWQTTGETWTSLAGTAITPGVATTAKYQVGDKIKFTQGGSTMYQYITSVSGTQFVSTGGTEYVLGTTAITSPFYAKCSNPQGFPTAIGYLPTFGGFSSSPATPVTRFSVVGNICFLSAFMGNGTSNSAVFTMTLPIMPKNVSNYWNHGILAADNGSYSDGGHITITGNDGTADLYKDGAETSWTASGNKLAKFQIFYEI